jgi:hypothetical protein
MRSMQRDGFQRQVHHLGTVNVVKTFRLVVLSVGTLILTTASCSKSNETKIRDATATADVNEVAREDSSADSATNAAEVSSFCAGMKWQLRSAMPRLGKCEPNRIQPRGSTGRGHAVKWRKPLLWGSPIWGTAFSAGRIAVVAGNKLFVLSSSGELIGSAQSLRPGPFSPPVTSPSGDFVVGGEVGLALSPGAKELWSMSLRTTPPDGSIARRIFAIGETSAMLTLETDGILTSFSASSGVFNWTRDIPAAHNGKGGLSSGWDSTALAWIDGDVELLNADDGRSLASFGKSAGFDAHMFPYVPNYGLVGRVRKPGSDEIWTVRYDEMLRPTCMRAAASSKIEYPLFVNLDGEFVTFELDENLTSGRWIRYGCDGMLAKTEFSSGIGTLRIIPTGVLGADGQSYIFLKNDFEIWLAAIGPGFEEVWRLKLPATDFGIGTGNGFSITEDGQIILNMSGDRTEGATVISVQTESPGLAATGMPNVLYGSRSAGWTPSQL